MSLTDSERRDLRIDLSQMGSSGQAEAESQETFKRDIPARSGTRTRFRSWRCVGSRRAGCGQERAVSRRRRGRACCLRSYAPLLRRATCVRVKVSSGSPGTHWEKISPMELGYADSSIRSPSGPRLSASSGSRTYCARFAIISMRRGSVSRTCCNYQALKAVRSWPMFDPWSRSH